MYKQNKLKNVMVFKIDINFLPIPCLLENLKAKKLKSFNMIFNIISFY